jgi:long-chain acyl-CoA synthetase
MSFLDQIFARLESAADLTLLTEFRDSNSAAVAGRELSRMISQARIFLAARSLNKGDRCALLAPNGVEWVAIDLAIMAEGLIAVPLYSRQAATELVAMMKDCSPSVICCGDATLRDGIAQAWPEAPPQVLFDEIFSTKNGTSDSRAGAPAPHQDSDPVTIIYTSGTSGEAKGVVLAAANVTYMLGSTSGRLDLLMNRQAVQDRQDQVFQDQGFQDQVFHYLPFCFAGSWIMLLTCLLRGSKLTLNTDLSKIAEQMRAARPDYFLNVPQLLERMRKAVDEQLWKTGGVPLAFYRRAKSAYMRKCEGDDQTTFFDSLWLALANRIIFPSIRSRMIGPQLRALICGSAPLNVETQLFFMMLGIPVLQVYGLTETTAICTMDDPQHVEPGRVGPAIDGIEMDIGENGEIIVRGANVFSGYWNRPQETANVLRDGWFHSGDQGERNGAGNWKITGRIKNLVILASGHNIAPEAIEDEILTHLPGAQQVVLVGNGRSYLSAVVTGKVSKEQVQTALNEVNAGLPHYKQVRAFRIGIEAFTIENGMLTANGKLKRDLIAKRFSAEISDMYAVKQAV